MRLKHYQEISCPNRHARQKCSPASLQFIMSHSRRMNQEAALILTSNKITPGESIKG
jgi:hypothetical protein